VSFLLGFGKFCVSLGFLPYYVFVVLFVSVFVFSLLEINLNKDHLNDLPTEYQFVYVKLI